MQRETMVEPPAFTTGLKSTVEIGGTLRLSLATEPLAPPREDEVVVEMMAAPLHPADIGLLLGPADLSTAVVTGDGILREVSIQIPPTKIASLRTRRGLALGVGNEGAGIVVAAGAQYQHLVGRSVAVMGGKMVTRYRVVSGSDALLIPDGVPVEAGAAVLINPLTALGMVETLRREGHSALVHTAAASSLGQMLNRICLADDIGLVSVVRRPEQVALLRSQGALHVCDSSSPGFVEELNAHISATGATLAFDAVGGGRLASQILSAMELHAVEGLGDYDRYGSRVRKQVYFYGGLDGRPSEIDRAYGMSWSIGGWLLFEELQRLSADRLCALRRRISDEMLSTFACDFAGRLSMIELLDPENLKSIAVRSTGEKYLVVPSLDPI